jgi:1-deoxy-D-xylulose-5-phosphate reductoisomerase
LKHIAILGSTGSIGQSTLSILESYPDRFAVASLAAGSNIDTAYAQCLRWRPAVVSLATETAAATLRARLKQAGIPKIEVVWGTAGTVLVATLPEVDFVVSAIVGVAGLEATYAAVLAGKPSRPRQERPAAAHRLRAQRDPPVHARRHPGRGRAGLAHRLGRPVSHSAAV